MRITDLIRRFRQHCVPAYRTLALSSSDTTPTDSALVPLAASPLTDEAQAFDEYVYLVDQFVFYGLGRRSSHRTSFTLASLLFETLLRDPIFAAFTPSALGQSQSRAHATKPQPGRRVWPQYLGKWVERLYHFVGIFTPTGGLWVQLHALAEALILPSS